MDLQENAVRPPPLNLGPVIIRVAGWPIETCDGLRSPCLATAVDRFLDEEERLRLNALRLSESLYALVPRIPDRALRAAVIRYRRCIFRSVDPVPGSLSRPLLSPDAVPPGVQESIRSHEQHRAALAARRLALNALYEASLAAEQEALRRITASPLFRKALCLASPATFRALEAEADDLNQRKPGKLHLTLYSYVMRAAGRATPNGLWASVVLATLPPDPSAPLQAEWSGPGRVSFVPDLSPFATALQAIARRDPWRNQVPLRLNPSLHQVGPSAWQFGDFWQGRWQVFEVAGHPCLAALPAAFAAGAELAGDIRDYLLAGQAVPSLADAEHLVGQMLDLGILWPAAGLPGQYADPISALKGAAPSIPPGERHYWDACVAELDDLCLRLNADFWVLSPAELHDALAAARDLVNGLIGRYGLAPVPDDANVLIADRLGPWRCSIAASLRERIQSALRACWTFDRYGLGEVQAIAERKREFAELLDGQDLSLAEFIRRHGAVGLRECTDQIGVSESSPESPARTPWRPLSPADPWESILERIDEPGLRAEAEEAFRRWYGELTPVAGLHGYRLEPGTRPVSAPLGPGSALILLDGPTADPVLRVGGITPDPCLFYSRFNRLFGGNHEACDPFIDWYRRSIEETERRFPGLRFADLCVQAGMNQNAASRPRITGRMLDGLDGDDPLISCARIRTGAGDRPRLYVPGQIAAVLPALNSAVSTDESDPYTHCLNRLWRLLGRPSLVRPLPRFFAEVMQWRHLPRLSLAANAVISPERWTPPPEVAEELARLSGPDRYLAWRRFSRAAGLSPHIYGQYGLHQTFTLMATDSILAVEHLGQALAAHGGPFLLQEAFPSPHDSWLRDPSGCHYVAELAIAWQGEDSFWESYLGDATRPAGYAFEPGASVGKTDAETAQSITRASARGQPQ